LGIPWLNSGTVSVYGVLSKGLYKYKLVQFYEGHQNTNRYISNSGGLGWDIFSFDFPLRHSELDPDFGT
jgi:hypothetical protein